MPLHHMVNMIATKIAGLRPFGVRTNCGNSEK